MISIEKSVESFNTFITDLRVELAEMVRPRIETQLEADVEAWLKRGYHERRVRVGQRPSRAQCQRCGTRHARRCSRNGHRPRQMATQLGGLNIGLPRVVCECGGSVTIPSSIVAPYQRLGDDVVEQIGRWATLGVSLRQMQNEIGETIGTQVGLRKRNEVVHQVPCPVEATLSSVPPIIMLDVIWMTSLEPTGATHPDRAGRQWTTKAKEKVCLLVALGLYPHAGEFWGGQWPIAKVRRNGNGCWFPLKPAASIVSAAWSCSFTMAVQV